MLSTLVALRRLDAQSILKRQAPLQTSSAPLDCLKSVRYHLATSGRQSGVINQAKSRWPARSDRI